MAIVFEEEKKSTNWVTIIGFAAVSIAILIGVYFLFFKKPELIEEVIVPGPFQDIDKLSGVKFDPKLIVESPKFVLLRDYAQLLPAAQKGRANPFKPQD